MTQTTARIKKDGKNFEVLVDLEEALKLRKDEGGNINSAVLGDAVFYNIKSGEHASGDDLKKAFGTDVFEQVAEQIIRRGEVVLSSDYIKGEQHQKYKQVIDFLVKNAVSPSGQPYPSDRIETALREAGVNVKNKPVESQVGEILAKIQTILPIKMEVKKIKITVPAQYTGSAYGILQDYKNGRAMGILLLF